MREPNREREKVADAYKAHKSHIKTCKKEISSLTLSSSFSIDHLTILPCQVKFTHLSFLH